MSRHASLEVLACYIEGVLKARRASKVASHLSGCSLCTGHIQELQQVPVMLSQVAFPPIPENLSYRIEMALVAESTTRLTAEPASGEASRRDLPARGSGPGRRRWRLPGFSSPLAGSLAAVGAAVIIAGGGYEIASHVGTAGPATSSSTAHQPSQPAAAANGKAASAAGIRAGPEVQFRHNGKTATALSIQSDTNFVPAKLQMQAQGALQAARLSPQRAAQGGFSNPVPIPSAANGINPRQLNGCVGKIAAGRNVLLVDLAMYQRKPATIIVVGTGPYGPGVVYAVGPACSATNADVLAQQSLPRTAP